MKVWVVSRRVHDSHERTTTICDTKPLAEAIRDRMNSIGCVNQIEYFVLGWDVLTELPESEGK